MFAPYAEHEERERFIFSALLLGFYLDDAGWHGGIDYKMVD